MKNWRVSLALFNTCMGHVIHSFVIHPGVWNPHDPMLRMWSRSQHHLAQTGPSQANLCFFLGCTSRVHVSLLDTWCMSTDRRLGIHPRRTNPGVIPCPISPVTNTFTPTNWTRAHALKCPEWSNTLAASFCQSTDNDWWIRDKAECLIVFLFRIID